MVTFPNCKINIGLQILGKRTDGYHNLQSVFLPVPLTDVLEIIPAPPSQQFSFSQTGIFIPGDVNENICIKAYRLLKVKYNLPLVHIHLHKIIPTGGGLGGGSSNGAHTLMLLNTVFNLQLSENELLDFALKLGSDCPFFIKNKPCFVSGRGEHLEPIHLDLSQYKIVIVNPGISVSTAAMFGKISAFKKGTQLIDAIQCSPEHWQESITNDFEHVVFPLYPALKMIKEKLYTTGALYASLSGSGSTVYGIFEKRADTKNVDFPGCSVYQF